jgi:DNA polymerase-3 subunit epsilon
MEAIFEAIRDNYKQDYNLYNLSRKFKVSIQDIRKHLVETNTLTYHLEKFCRQHQGQTVFLFDLETTGLPARKSFDEYYPYTSNPHYDSSRIVQLAYCIYRIGDPLPPVIINYFRKPEQFTVPTEASNIHGLTQDFLEQNGVSFQTIVRSGFLQELEKCDFVMSHNTGFDVNILCNELFRVGSQIPSNLGSRTVCSCKLTSWTKLEALYKLLVPGSSNTQYTQDIQFHNAKDDVSALYQILHQLSLKSSVKSLN